MRRKQQISQFKAEKAAATKGPKTHDPEDVNLKYIPIVLGKTDPSLIKMSKDEIKTIHEAHKRESGKLLKCVLRKEEFEIN